MNKYITYILGGLLIGGIARYFYDYTKLFSNNKKEETDIEKLINGNKRFVKKKQKINAPSRILIIKQFSGLNPKVIFDSPYIDVISSSKFDHIILKVIENMFYETQYNTIVVLSHDSENKQAKEYLQELLYESKFLRNLVEAKKLKPYWSSYNSTSGDVIFYHLYDRENNRII